ATRAGVVVLPPAPPVPQPPPGRPPLPQTTDPPPTPELLSLGQLLFFERRLGADGTTRCAACHDPAHGYSGVDPRSQNALGKVNRRRTPSLYDVGWQTELGWDGRGGDRLRFVMGHATGQLGVSLDDSARNLQASPTYRALFARAGDPSQAGHTAGGALLSFAVTRYSPDSPWDQQERGVAGAASPEAVAGYAIFNGKAQCAMCHPPPLYTDLAYHRLGLVATSDDGRGVVDPAAARAFKTPGLRGAALRVRFFHDGSAASLEAAIDWHLAGGTGQGAAPADIDPALPPIHLTPEERGALIAFVRALSAPPVPVVPPTLPEDVP
ncbi:MAG TPA: cytochrome c peroxidase, partial [Kofleriaceae bacterium]|nr:cytochrome c peroxidase [Kofleriaceae bacterium]